MKAQQFTLTFENNELKITGPGMVDRGDSITYASNADSFSVVFGGRSPFNGTLQITDTSSHPVTNSGLFSFLCRLNFVEPDGTTIEASKSGTLLVETVSGVPTSGGDPDIKPNQP